MTTDVLQFDKITFEVGNVYQKPETTCETLLSGLVANRFIEKTGKMQV